MKGRDAPPSTACACPVHSTGTSDSEKTHLQSSEPLITNEGTEIQRLELPRRIHANGSRTGNQTQVSNSNPLPSPPCQEASLGQWAKVPACVPTTPGQRGRAAGGGSRCFLGQPSSAPYTNSLFPCKHALISLNFCAGLRFINGGLTRQIPQKQNKMESCRFQGQSTLSFCVLWTPVKEARIHIALCIHFFLHPSTSLSITDPVHLSGIRISHSPPLHQCS